MHAMCCLQQAPHGPHSSPQTQQSLLFPSFRCESLESPFIVRTVQSFYSVSSLALVVISPPVYLFSCRIPFVERERSKVFETSLYIECAL